jgi:Ca2+-binding EF-hand superfamily protein
MGDEGLKKVFAAFDTDGSGEISIEELSAALEKGGKSIEPDEVCTDWDRVSAPLLC